MARQLTVEQEAIQRAFAAEAECPIGPYAPQPREISEPVLSYVLPPCDEDVCGLGFNGLSCNLPALHPNLHDWEDPEHVARVESFLDEQDRLRAAERQDLIDGYV